MHEVLKSVAAVEALADDWRRLTREDAAPFSTFGWNREWLRAFEGSFEETAVTVSRRAGEVSAIVPFYRSGGQLRFAGDTICDYQDVIAVDAEAGKEGFAATVEEAMSRGLSVRAPQIATGTLAFELLDEAARRLPCVRYARHYCPAPFMELAGTWEEFSRTLSKNLRADVRRRQNKMAREKGGSEARFLEGAGITPQVLESIGAMHAGNQHRKEGESLFSDPRFVKMMLGVAGDPEVGLHVSLLESGGETMAFILGFLRKRRYYLYLTAYESDFEDYAPGKVLIHELVKHVVEKGGVEVFDFLNGPEPYKYQWAKSAYDVYEFTLSPRTALNRIAAAAKTSRDRARKGAKRALVRMGLYERLMRR